jgi:hypothetical protein
MRDLTIQAIYFLIFWLAIWSVGYVVLIQLKIALIANVNQALDKLNTEVHPVFGPQ